MHAIDTLIFGGGIAGLWLLDTCRTRGLSALLIEKTALGHGQTVASQGIIHGGLKYALSGKLTAAAQAVSAMPRRWLDSQAGRATPDLSASALSSPCCLLWRKASLHSRLGLAAAKVALQTRPRELPEKEIPGILQTAPRPIYRVDEPVFHVRTVLKALVDANAGRVIHLPEDEAIVFEQASDGSVTAVHLESPGRLSSRISLAPKTVVLTAGSGNAALRRRLGLDATRMQRRPLHMAVARGNLPPLFGHCIDGHAPRLTITSLMQPDGSCVWQVGGQLAESGVDHDPARLIETACEETRSLIPGFDPDSVRWSTYRVDRAEGLTADGSRPDDAVVIRDRNVLTAWPTKLALAPVLSDRLVPQLPAGGGFPGDLIDGLKDAGFPAPLVAPAPWEAS